MSYEDELEQKAHDIAYGECPMPEHPSYALRTAVNRIRKFMVYSHKEKGSAKRLIGRRVDGGFDRFFTMRRDGVLTGIVSDFSGCCYEIDRSVRVPYIREARK